MGIQPGSTELLSTSGQWRATEAEFDLAAEFVLDRLPSGRCHARVRLTWLDDREYEGEAKGLTSQAGELRYSIADITAARQALEYHPTRSIASDLDAVIDDVRRRS